MGSSPEAPSAGPAYKEKLLSIGKGKLMTEAQTGTRGVGAWLAIGALLLAGALVFHGPPAPDLGTQMKTIAEGAGRWVAVHWVAAAALSAFAVAGLVALTTGTRLTQGWSTMSAWALMVVGALWTVTTAVAEATVIAAAAVAGNQPVFEAWWRFAEGKANGFAFLALAVAVIAANEARLPRAASPAWASWLATLAGVAAFAGWAVGAWLRIGGGSLVWVVSSLVMCLWLLWLGVGLLRAEVRAQRRVAGEPEAAR
jgi:hypothetical protein